MNELTEGKGHYVEIDGFELAVFLNEGSVTVLDNMCPHAGANLAGGEVVEGCAVCPMHNWAFRLDNGELRDSPGVSVRKYPTRILDYEGKRLVQADLPSY
jgi:nitrite reductase (NADH) small subunit